MTGFITAACPSCGGTLYLAGDTGRLTCIHCGAENVVRPGSSPP